MYPIIQIFNYPIPTFGIFFLIGTVLAFLLSTQTAKKYRIPTMDIIFFGLFGLIGGIFGAKLLYILVNLNLLYVEPLNTIIKLMSGGSVFYGGLLGGILSGYFYTHIYQLNAIEFFDVSVPCLSLAQAFGRIGCFFNGCCYGVPYHGFGCVVYPEGAYPPSGIGLFPTQLAESAFMFLLCIGLILFLRKNSQPGKTTGVYLLVYGLFRFLLEFLRDDPRGSLLIFSTSQIIGLFIIFLGILFFLNIPQVFYEKKRNS